MARGQLLRLGLAPNAIDRGAAAGRLHTVHGGVYAVGHLALTPRSRWTAAVLASGPGAVLSHRTAAALWGIREPGSGPIEVTSPRKSRSTGTIRRHFADLPEDERGVVEGIPVTSVVRTIFDLAAVAEPHSVEAALREAEYLQLRDRLSLPALLARYPRHRGSKAIHAALDRRREDPGGRTRSPLEDLFLPFLDRHSIPRPRINVPIQVGEERYEVDCLWEPQSLIVELDGFASHKSRTSFEDDRERDRRLTSLGYRVTRITSRQLERQESAVAFDLDHLLLFTSVRDNVRPSWQPQ